MTKADTENILSRRDRLALGTAISAVPTSLMPVRSVNSSLCRCLGYNSGAGYLSFGGCLPGEMGETRLCDSDDRAPKGVLPFYEAPVVDFFPNRKLGARRAPCFHRFFVASRASCQPGEEVDDECFDGCVTHTIFLPLDA